MAEESSETPWSCHKCTRIDVPLEEREYEAASGMVRHIDCGGEVTPWPVRPERTPTLEEVLEGLKLHRESFQWGPIDEDRLDAAIAYLGADPVEAFAENYAARLDGVADTWDEEGYKADETRHAHGLHGRAEGLREAARLLRDKDSR